MENEKNCENEINDASAEVKDTAAESAEENITECTKENEDDDAESIVAQQANDLKKATGSATKQPVKIKKKKSVNMTTLTVVIAAVVVVLACAAFALYKTGTFKKWFPTKASMTIADHETIEIDESVQDVSDDSIETYVSSFTEYYSTTEEVTEGTVEDGDTVHIVYTGKVDGEEFDGGSTGEDGADLTIGSDSYIDGFEDGLIGVSIGSETVLNLTFPEDYSSTDLAGKDVEFTVSVEYKEVTTTPEFTDEFVSENSAEYTKTQYGESQQIDTVEEYREYIRERLYNMQLEDAIEDAIYDLITVKSYDGAQYDKVYAYKQETLSQYASYYGTDADTLASYYGYASADLYCQAETEYQLTLCMLYTALAEEFGITHTQEEIDAAITEYMDESGYSETYSLDEFKETSGEVWLYMYENYQMNYEPIMEIMKERVVFVEVEEETTAETEADETSEETSAAE